MGSQVCNKLCTVKLNRLPSSPITPEVLVHLDVRLAGRLDVVDLNKINE